MGFSPTGKRRLCTAHTPQRSFDRLIPQGSECARRRCDTASRFLAACGFHAQNTFSVWPQAEVDKKGIERRLGAILAAEAYARSPAMIASILLIIAAAF